MRYLTAAVLSLSMLAGAAQASEWVYTLTEDACSGTCGAGPYGTVTLLDVGSGASAYVLVTEALNPSDEFVKTGAGDALEFQLSTTPTSITDLTSGFSLASGSQSASAFGSFTNGVTCSGCGNGASSPLPGPITFEVHGVTTADFVANSDGNYFASDILGSNGKTGNVGSDSGVDPPVGTPEPGTLVLISTGGLMVFIGLRRRAKS